MGAEGLLLEWDGSNWHRHDSHVDTTLCGAWASTEGSYFVVGDDLTVLSRQSKVWIRHDVDTSRYPLEAVWGSALDDVYAACIFALGRIPAAPHLVLSGLVASNTGKSQAVFGHVHVNVTGGRGQR